MRKEGAASGGSGKGVKPFFVSLALSALSIGAVLTAVFFLELPPVYRAEYWSQDRLMQSRFSRKTPVNEDFVLLGIDQPSRTLDTVSEEEIAASRGLQLMKRTQDFPWVRSVYAELLDRLCGRGGARLVVFDLLFLSEGEGDEEFRAALDRYADRVVVAGKLEEWQADQRGNTTWTFDQPSPSILPQTRPADVRAGYVTFFPDRDDVVRSIRVETTIDLLEGNPVHVSSEWYQSFTAAVLRQLGRTEHLDRRKTARPFRFTDMAGETGERAETYAPQSIYQVFVDKIWRDNYAEGAFFKDRIVFVGPTASQFQDDHPTPFKSMLGVHLHMNAVAAALADEFYEESSAWVDFFLIVAMGGLAWLIVLLVKAPMTRLFILIGVAVLYVAAAIAVFNHLDVLITCMSPLTAFGSSGLLCFGYDFARHILDELRVRRALERYVSKDLAHEILADRENYFNALGGVDKPMTMLFSDIRGFTTITEEMGGKELVPKLNEYLGEMVPAVFANEGTLDKFIGDAVMAVWGNVKSDGPKVDATRAVDSAVEMRERLAKLNVRWAEEGKKLFHIGIGLNHGQAIFGNIGSEERMDPTVIGDAVNLAARLESLTKEYHCDIIVSESVAELVRDKYALRSVDKVIVKGKTEAVEIFHVLGAIEDAGAFPDWLVKYERGVRDFRARRFEEAKRCFGEILEAKPEDYLSAMYLKNTEAFLLEPPGPEWAGVTTMTRK